MSTRLLKRAVAKRLDVLCQVTCHGPTKDGIFEVCTVTAAHPKQWRTTTMVFADSEFERNVLGSAPAPPPPSAED